MAVFRAWLESNRASAITEALNRVHATEGPELDPVMGSVQALSLPQSDGEPAWLGLVGFSPGARGASSPALVGLCRSSRPTPGSAAGSAPSSWP